MKNISNPLFEMEIFTDLQNLSAEDYKKKSMGPVSLRTLILAVHRPFPKRLNQSRQGMVDIEGVPRFATIPSQGDD